MDHHIGVTVELGHDAFAEPAEPADRPPLELCRRRVGGAQREGAADADPLEPAPDDAWRESVQIDDDVRELGHGGGWGGWWRLSRLVEVVTFMGDAALRPRRDLRARRPG